MTNHAAARDADAPATRPFGSPLARPAVRVAGFVAALSVLAAVAGGFASFTWHATAGVLVCAAVVVAIGGRVPRRSARRPGHTGPEGSGSRPGLRDASPWLAWCCAFAALWGSAYLTGSRPAHPTLSLLLDPVLEPHPARSLAFLAWLLLGWRLVRR